MDSGRLRHLAICTGASRSQPVEKGQFSGQAHDFTHGIFQLLPPGSEPVAACRTCGAGNVSRRGEVDLVVQEVDDSHRPADTRPLGKCGALLVEGLPGTDRGSLNSPPVQGGPPGPFAGLPGPCGRVHQEQRIHGAGDPGRVRGAPRGAVPRRAAARHRQAVRSPPAEHHAGAGRFGSDGLPGEPPRPGASTARPYRQA